MTRENFLFLGDSVTDCDRDRQLKQPNRPEGLGNGWVNQVATQLLVENAQRKIWNRGYSGCLTHELLAQEGWMPVKSKQRQPFQCITLLIGINDIWHPFNNHQAHMLDEAIQAFVSILNQLQPLTERLIVMEPFAIPGPAVHSGWWPLLEQLQLQQRTVTEAAGATWCPVQKTFGLESQCTPDLWAYDGVHPGVLGHRWLAQCWLDTATS